MSHRAAIYARVSSAQQEEEKTITSQVDALDQAAIAMGLTVGPERRYIDDGFSGTRLDRPALDALRDAVADGLVDIVLIHDPDRLARNYVHQQVILEEMTKRGAHVHFVAHPVGERAEDRLLLQVQGVIAEYERAKILERSRRGKRHKVRTGEMLPFTKPPYGYAIVRAPAAPQGMIVIDDVEAERVRTIFHWITEEGLTLHAVTRRMNAVGWKPRLSKRWSESTVYRIVKNPAYAGLAVFGKLEPCESKRPQRPGSYTKRLHSSSRPRPESQWIRVPVPAIIDEKTQKEALAHMHANRRDCFRRGKHEYLLRTLVVCGECGLRMSCIHHMPSGKQQRHYLYYGCMRSPTQTSREHPCHARQVRADALDTTVWSALVEWIQTPQILMQTLEASRALHSETVDLVRERGRAEAADRRLQLQIDRLVDAYQAGALSVQELKARRERLEEERAALRRHLEDAVAEQRNAVRLDRLAEDVTAFASSLRVGLGDLDFAGRQRLVRLLIERIVVNGDRVTIEHVVPLSGRYGALPPRSAHDELLFLGGQARLLPEHVLQV